MAKGSMYSILSEEDKNKVDRNTTAWAAATAAGDAAAANAAHIGNAVIYAGYGYNTNPDGSVQTPMEGSAQSSAASGGTGYINDMYDSAIDAGTASLKADYENNLKSLSRAREQIEPAYYAARNEAASDTARSKDAWNEYAAAQGLNSGVSGQAELARNSVYQANMTGLNQAEADAEADAELQIQQLRADYTAAVNQVRAEQEAARVQALLEEYYRQQDLQKEAEETAYSRSLQKAQILAGVGDYSGYRALGYTDAEIAVLEKHHREDIGY